ncbi:MAG: chemotaxis protein CheW [Gammaproteobacteria bacterium]|nr:MAG: chemotaxis protein CheW [Gammaproteobacteria bacterium]
MTEERKAPPITLVEQHHALDAYLDSLLAEATEPVAETPEPAVALQVVVDQPAPVEAPAEPALSEVAHPAPEAVPRPEPATRPDWAEGRFQCLIFHVQGLKLAVPLARLNGILPWDEDITRLPGRAPHLVGLVKSHGETVRVVDTTRLVLPPDRQPPAIGEAGREAPSHIILVGQRRWGLSCDGLADTVTLEPDAVHWRGSRGKRPWLAGTVIDHMCALLDTDAFVDILEHDTPALDEDQQD